MITPIKSTPRLNLRGFTKADAVPLFEILAVEGVLQYFPSSNPPDLSKVESFIQRQINHWKEHGFGRWALEPKSKEELIGWCGLQYLPETDEIEVGYALKKEYWGRGLATEAALFTLNHTFNDLEIDSIIAIVHPDNQASQRVIDKLGMPFIEEGRYFEMDCCRYKLERKTYLKMHSNFTTG